MTRSATARGTRITAALLALHWWAIVTNPALAASAVVVVEGLSGAEQYRSEFADQVEAVVAAANTLSPQPDVEVFRSGATRESILEYFDGLTQSMSGSDQLSVYLIGHGSYDEHEYKFNIAGPDLTDSDIREALDQVPSGNQVLVNTSSASGAGGELWQADNRVVITATRSGAERHATRFGVRFVAALTNDSADLDKNGIVTAREAFDFADRGVREYFENAGQLATEHAELSGDNANRLTLARLIAVRAPTADEELRQLRASRDDINGEIERLRLARDAMPADDYQSELLSVMLELAEVEEAIERREVELQDEE